MAIKEEDVKDVEDRLSRLSFLRWDQIENNTPIRRDVFISDSNYILMIGILDRNIYCYKIGHYDSVSFEEFFESLSKEEKKEAVFIMDLREHWSSD